MSSVSTSSISEPVTLQQGDFEPPAPDSVRCACPIMNAFANHGYIPRDGRNVTQADLRSAIKVLGIDHTLTEALVGGTFAEYDNDTEDKPSCPVSDQHNKQAQCPNNPIANGKYSPRPPYANNALNNHGTGPSSGLRPRGQVNSDGLPIVHLDQLARHGVVEHDVSLTRHDFSEGDNVSPYADLVAAFLASSDDGKVLTTTDLANFRKQRYAEQKRDNPELNYSSVDDNNACSEVAFLQAVFGRGWRWQIPVDYMSALFREERLPVKEGWTTRRFPVTLPEFYTLSTIMKRYSGIDPPPPEKSSNSKSEPGFHYAGWQ